MNMGCFCSLAIMNNVAVNIHVQVFCGYVFLFFLGIRVELLDHVETVCLIFWETARLVFKVATPFTFPSAMYKCSNFHSLTNSHTMSVFSLQLSHGFPTTTKSPIFWLQRGILQFSSVLTLTTWSQHRPHRFKSAPPTSRFKHQLQIGCPG